MSSSTKTDFGFSPLRAVSSMRTKMTNFLGFPVFAVISSMYFEGKSPRHSSPVSFSSISIKRR